jgi:hypothetical protein
MASGLLPLGRSMPPRLESWINRTLAAWTDAVGRHARATVLALLTATVLLGLYAGTHLRLNTDTGTLIDDGLPFRQTHARFASRFPVLDDALLVVVDADTPARAQQAAADLADRLGARPDLFTDVFVVGAGRFFERAALLHLDLPDLERVATRVAELQPLLAGLAGARDPAGLAVLLERHLDGAGRTSTAASALVLEQVTRALTTAHDPDAAPLAWEAIVADSTALDLPRRRVIVAQPVLDFRSLLPARRPIEAVRTTAEALGLEPAGGVRVRVTGNPALNHEEMAGLVWDIGVSSFFSFALVTLVLYAALRSVRLVAAALATLLAGLVWTGAFAAAAVGSVNLVSICFGVLCIGLGVDFAIHMGMSYAARRRRGLAHAPALREAARTTGSSLVLCALTTTIGFWVFVPTPYRGVGELGLISGAGMIVSLGLTMTLLPALLGSVLGDDRPWAAAEPDARGRTRRDRRRTVLRAAALLLGSALVLLPQSRFDPNVVRVRNPATESVQAFRDLLAATDVSPWNIDVLVPDLDAARRLADRVAGLDVVARTVTLGDLVPERQEEKLALLARLGAAMRVPALPEGTPPPAPVAAQVAALRALEARLGATPVEAMPPALGRRLQRLHRALGRFLGGLERQADPGARLAALDRVLLGALPEELDRLRRLLAPTPVTVDDVPAELRGRMLAPDGQARVQVFARDDLGDGTRLAAFVDAVRAVHPDVTGLAVNILEFGRATVASLRQALVSALVLIVGLLWLLWRRVSSVVLVLVPLLLGAALTGAAMVVLGIPYNFVNVIVLPLLLGIGVDSGIHLVHQAEHQPDAGRLGSTTARAVFYSAVTTITSFGSLAFSAHAGMASLGTLLVVGLLLVLGCNLLVLPALLAWRRGPATARRTGGEGDYGLRPALVD